MGRLTLVLAISCSVIRELGDIPFDSRTIYIEHWYLMWSYSDLHIVLQKQNVFCNFCSILPRVRDVSCMAPNLTRVRTL